MGDGALVEFAARSMRSSARSRSRTRVAEREAGEPEDRRLAFRIGINVGDIIVEEGDI